ncbi:MAG: alpha/beta hydrolase [Rubrobacter sp.]
MKIRSRDVTRIKTRPINALRLGGHGDTLGGVRSLTAGALLASSLVAGGSVLLAGLAARRLITPSPSETQFLTPWELGISYRDISFVTADGLKLKGWWLPNPGARRTVVALCGYNSARHHVLGISAALWRGGANVLLFDNRGRGDSEGETVSLGYYERLDAEAAVGYAKSRSKELPLGVIGYSMGGAVGIMVAAEDDRIEALVVDSPFASQTALLRARLRDYVGPLEYPAFALASRFLDYEPGEVEPAGAVPRVAPRPILFIHGEEDTVTAPEDSRRMYDLAGEPKELWLVPGAGHIGSYYRDRESYCRRVNAFFEKHLTD